MVVPDFLRFWWLFRKRFIATHFTGSIKKQRSVDVELAERTSRTQLTFTFEYELRRFLSLDEEANDIKCWNRGVQSTTTSHIKVSAS